MSTSFYGARTLNCSVAVLVATAVPPVGRQKILFDALFDMIKGSFGVPAVDVAPVSLTADAMVPSMMPCLSCMFVIVVAFILLCRFCFAFSHGFLLFLIRHICWCRHYFPFVCLWLLDRVNLTVGFVGGSFSSAST